MAGRKPPGRRLIDFGGQNARGLGSTSRIVAPEDCFSMRCSSCDKLHYISRIELSRASRPKCTNCGGGLVEIEANYYKRIGKTPTQLKRQKKAEDAQKPFKCQHCELAFRNEVALKLHDKEKHGKPKMIPDTHWHPVPGDIAWQQEMIRVLKSRATWAVPGARSVFRIDKDAQQFALLLGEPDDETNRRIAKVFRIIGFTEVDRSELPLKNPAADDSEKSEPS